MRKIRRRVQAIVLVFVLMMSTIGEIPGIPKNVVQAAATSGIMGNGTGGISININASPYTDYSRIPTHGKFAYGTSGCAWFASARARQLTGKGTTIYSGQNWWNNQYRTYGFSRGSQIKAPAIMCWSGHVAILEKVVGNTAYISEGGSWRSDANHGYSIIRTCPTSTMTIAKDNAGNVQTFYGYVYLSGSSSGTATNPAPVANAQVKAVSCDKYDTNLVPRAKVYNPSKRRVTTVGIKIKDGNNVIGSKEEMMDAKAQYYSSSNIWFDLTKELGLTLRRGHVYSWQIYADIGGKRCYTDWINDKTTGTEKPSAPSFSIAKKDYAVGDAVTVNWGADANAVGGYSLTITQTRGGTYSKTLTTASASATSLAFTLPNVGEYKITGFAKGSENSETSTLNKTIVAHAPSTVRFVEYDKDENENLLCEQTVRYGYSATAPNGISRKGHTFTGWKGEYSNVTSDRTIVAQFKRNTYKVVFYDKDDNIIDTQSVLYEDDATAPEPPAAESGYVFAGWDNEDYKNVQGNVKVKACYVWANEDLPVLVEINSCEYNEDGYIVNYNIKNNPDKRTRCRGIFSLRTSKGKLINSTESGAFSLAAGEYRENQEMYIPYDGVATNVSLYIVDRFASGIPYSQTVSYEIEREWSDWSEMNPGEEVEVEERTEYRYRNLLSATTRTPVNEGWDLADTIFDTSWSFGAWSSWSRTAYSAIETTTTKREVQSRSVSDNNGYTRNTYYYWKDPNKLAFSYYNEGGMIYYEYTQCSNDSQPRMYVYGTYNGQTMYRLNNNNNGYGVNFNSEVWFLKSSTNVPATTHKEYSYRDGSKGYTYKWTRWDTWSEWLTNEVTANSSKEIETRTAYRYRAKMEDLENNDGKEYSVSGKVDSSLAGKEALIQVYKGDEPSDSNNEYVGKVEIKEDGSFAHSFICRQEISEKTGDYKVMMAIEGGSEPFYLETIEAPKPVYTVVFKDVNGNIIDTQKVTEGHSATAPKVPEEENYTFVGWDFGVTNIRDDMEITAQYVKNKYSVAFVNWETEEVITEVFDYGDPVTYPDVTEIEGYEFVEWTTTDGEKCDTVTENTVLMANYKIKSYDIVFYDYAGEKISTQKVEYGKDALVPETVEIENMVFEGWSSYGFNNVKESLDIYPIYKYIETAATPSCDTESGVFTKSQEIHLSASNGAEIYYTMDGTIPTKASQRYEGSITIDKNTYLQFIASEPNKNTSDVVSVSFLVASGEDDEGALVVKKEKYEMNRGENSQITYFLSHEDPDIEVKFYSLNDKIATVNEDGTVYANNVGKTQIFISTADNKYADYCDIEVTTTDIDVEEIQLDKTSIIGVQDEKIQVNATVYPEDATEQEVDWYTDDESIASVSEDGEVTIKKKGITILRAYASSGSCIAECQVKGIGEYADSKMQMSAPYLFLYENDVDYLYVYYDDADVQCSWESSNEEVATVEDGIVTAKKSGTALIAATAEDGTQVTSLAVVSKAVSDPSENGEETPAPTSTPMPVASPNATNTPTDKKDTQAEATVSPENKTSNTNSSVTTYKPTKVTINKVVKSGKKKLKVTWKWSVEADGYQIQYAQNKKFTKKKKTVKVASWKSNQTLKGLKSKKTYYVRVRAYKKDTGGKVYGSWSKVKKCKVK
nr:Ig-like domain-containing protein [Eubacterium sp.]